MTDFPDTQARARLGGMVGMTMIERVARAADPALWRCLDSPEDAAALGEAEARRAYSLAGAEEILRAMREPSEAMVDKAWQMLRSNLRYEEVYRHLIDAALADTPTPGTAP